MIYLSGSDTTEWRSHAASEPIGIITTPDIGYTSEAAARYRWWAADNACFKRAADDFDLEGFFVWLRKFDPVRRSCLFAVSPDVVGDWGATLARSLPVIPSIRALGYPAAIVLQDGAEPSTLPDCDAVFVGGSTAWKTGQAAERCCGAARSRGMWVHMGRVNSRRRLYTAAQFGCDSVDGTFVAFGPEINTRRMLRFLRSANNQGTLQHVPKVISVGI